MQEKLFNDGLESGATFSECGKYRYALWRIWDESKPLVMFIGLNPSTADAVKPDPTIRCVTKFSEKWGYGGFYMMNLFGIISSKPEILDTCDDPMGDNKNHLEAIAKKCKDVVFAWGKFQQTKDVRIMVEEMFPNALCIGSKDGHPYHPLWAGMWAPKELKQSFNKPKLFDRFD